mmetsp:Transcript_34026/g.59198  ORF Transcript_34026/g.59198 Transcript_34026/m.59198 type:complete len:228 (-) Transcript_34026:53-736(-)
MSTPSRALPCFTEFLMSFFKPLMRSPRTVQQMQPLFISTMFSSSAIDPPFTKLSSMPTSPNSFSIIAMRLPWCAERMWFSNVVFPLPRNPVSTETGTLSSEPFSILSPDSSFARFVFTCSSSGLSIKAESYSTAARLDAPKPWSKSPRTANNFCKEVVCSGVKEGLIFSRNDLGSFKISESLPPTSVSKSSMQGLIFWMPSKNLLSLSAASASAKSSCQVPAMVEKG